MQEQYPFNAAAALQYRLWQKRELQDLRRISRAGGCALLFICTMQLVLAIGLDVLREPAARLIERYIPGSADLFWNGLAALLIGLFAVMPGALLGLRMLTPAEHNFSLPFRRIPAPDVYAASQPAPSPRFNTAKVVFAGAFLCFVGNVASTLIAAFAARYGYGFVGPEEVPSETTAEFLFMTLAIAFVPAIGEEVFFRGLVMQPLRRYGDGFALVCSALLFSILHQNMVQAPMAFCAGLALGWAALKTGTLWAPILIHLWNNGASLVLLALEKPLGDHANAAMPVYIVLLAALGIGSLLSLMRRGGQRPRAPHPITAGTRAANYFFGSPAMVVALLYMAAMLALGIQAKE